MLLVIGLIILFGAGGTIAYNQLTWMYNDVLLADQERQRLQLALTLRLSKELPEELQSRVPEILSNSHPDPSGIARYMEPFKDQWAEWQFAELQAHQLKALYEESRSRFPMSFVASIGRFAPVDSIRTTHTN